MLKREAERYVEQWSWTDLGICCRRETLVIYHFMDTIYYCVYKVVYNTIIIILGKIPGKRYIMNNNMTIFAQALTVNSTIKSRKAALINGEHIGVDNFAKWKAATHEAYMTFYNYNQKVLEGAFTEGVDTVKVTTYAMNALQALLDLIGDVNGHRIVKNTDMIKNVLASVAPYSIKNKTERVGEACKVASELANYKKEYRNLGNGVSAEYVAELEKNIEETKARLATLDTMPGSGATSKIRVNESTFRFELERTLAQIITKQSMKTWEELEEEENKRKQEKKDRRREQRQAAAAARAAASK